MITSTTPPAADPESSLRPRRYGIAIAVAALVVLALIASSILNYVYLDTIPGRASLYGLLTVALITLGTYILVRAYDRDRASRRKHLIRAGVLIGLGVLLWLLVIDVFLFTQSAGPGVAAICALACLPTTAFGLLVVRRMDRNHKEPWRLVLVAAAWGAIVATSLVVWGETIWEASAQRALVPGPGLDTSLAFMAGILEELAKGLAVLLLYLVMRNEFDDVVDGIVYGAAVGLGFNFLESISYMTNVYSIFSAEGFGWVAAGIQWYGRQVLGLFFGHATYTAFIGAGVGIARQLHGRRQKVLAIMAGFIVAIAGHFSWDAWATVFPIQNTLFGLVEIHLRTLIMTGPFTAALIALLLFGIRYEGQNLLEQMRKEAGTGQGAILP
ncbi:MAG: PrsW family intramembrane metalloprotease, partial [Chloroflexi bacterium]